MVVAGQARLLRDKERIEELEEALKQSVKITTKCEMDVARQKDELTKQSKLIDQVRPAVSHVVSLIINLIAAVGKIRHPVIWDDGVKFISYDILDAMN